MSLMCGLNKSYYYSNVPADYYYGFSRDGMNMVLNKSTRI